MRIARSYSLVFAAFTALALGCGGDDDKIGERKPDAQVADSGVADAKPDAGPGCTRVPAHGDIINAATDSETVDKQPALPLLKSDGTLPPLP
jgi:hypothetical protein